MRVSSLENSKDTYVTGLTWQVLDPMGESVFGHHQIPKIIESGAKYFAKYKNISEVNMGTLKASLDVHIEKTKKSYSFAVSVATHKKISGKTCLVLIKDPTSEDESIGLAIGLVAGNVVIDEHFAISEIDSIYQTFEFLCSKSGRKYFLAGDLCPIGTEIAEENRIDFKTLLKDRSAKKIQIEELKNERFALTVLASIFGLLLLFGIYEIWDWYSAKKSFELEAIKRQRNSPEAIYDDSVQMTLSKLVLIPNLAGEEFANAIGTFPAVLGGWKITSIKCEELDCTATWKSIGGTYENFKSLSDPKWGDINLGGTGKDALGDLNTLSHKFSLAVKTDRLPPVADWPTADSYSYEQGVDWQKLKDYNWRATLSAAEQQAIPVSMNPAAVREHPRAIYAMKWTVEKQDWSTGRLILPLLKKHITLNRFELNFDHKDGSSVFSASGLAYVKK